MSELDEKIARFQTMSYEKRKRVLSDLSSIMKSAKSGYADSVAAAISVLETIHKNADSTD